MLPAQTLLFVCNASNDAFTVLASDADAGWGAWSVETGWTAPWIHLSLGLRHGLGHSLRFRCYRHLLHLSLS